ncbi:replication initiator protein A [Lactobacillus hominis]|uniref:replication initiator protein A n=1 Tax=Lactobacillus hominis TaxID=1203033 RepID=UPI0026295143|nr:replication initiator protein A [Lactobacillus hominis]
MSATPTEPTNFYKVNEIYVEKFYQMPKVLFTNPKYAKLKNDDRVAYSLLKDRNSISIKNHWFDEEGNIYFIFTNDELMRLLNCGKEKLGKIKDRLISVGLLYQKRMGRNKPNRLYLLKPEVTAEDVYLQVTQESTTKNEFIKKDAPALEPQGAVKNTVPEKEAQTVDTSGSSKIELPEKEAQTVDTSGSSKIELPEKEAQTVDTSGSSKIEHNQDHTILDTNKIHTDTSLDFSSKNYSQQEQEQQNSELVHSAAFFMTKTDEDGSYILNHDATAFLASWCKTPAQMYKLIGIILNAKKSVEKEMLKQRPKDSNLSLLVIDNENSELRDLISLTVKRYFNAIKVGEETGKPIKDYEGYLYRTMENMFWSYVNKHSV